MQTTIKRPSLGLYFSEVFRAMGERVSSISFRREYSPEVKGDGRPILVIPGFMTTDASTKPLRTFLTRIGYTVYPWGLGRNLANLKDLSILLKKVEGLYAQHQEKITLIGWSLGGVYARELAKTRPEYFRQVITLASPFAGVNAPNNVTWIFNLIKGKKQDKEFDESMLRSLPAPSSVPTTAIYTKKDGIVPWEVCMEKIENESGIGLSPTSKNTAALRKNIEVNASHLGMGVNKEVLEIIVEELNRVYQ